MKITKTQLRKIIKEELLKESTWLANDAQYPRELLSNVSKAIDWDVGQAFAFVVDLLEDVNAHDVAELVNRVILQREADLENAADQYATQTDDDE
jgi:hypothetical protein